MIPMNEFDVKAAEWDSNPMHWDRSKAIAEEMVRLLPLSSSMKALEFGAGTGILSFMLKEHLHEITLMDNSIEMIKIMNDKIEKTKVSNLNTIYFNLEDNDYKEKKFDLIYTQMVLHHVADVEGIINRFHRMLNPNGYLAIADLYKEDGSFHGDGFDGHNGFEVDDLIEVLAKNGFNEFAHKKCFVVNREMANGDVKPFPLFLLIAKQK